MSEGNALEISTFCPGAERHWLATGPLAVPLNAHIGSNAVPTRAGAREASDLRGDLPHLIDP